MTARAPHAPGMRISNCVRCNAPLPLSESHSPQEARLWQCTDCGREYRAELAKNYRINELRSIRPEPLEFDRSQIVAPSSTLLKAHANLPPAQNKNFRDKRRSNRFEVNKLIPGMPLDGMLTPCEPACLFVSRDISQNGIGLYSDRAVVAAFLALELSPQGGESIQVLLNIMRSRPRGTIFEIGGEFITRMIGSGQPSLR